MNLIVDHIKQITEEFRTKVGVVKSKTPLAQECIILKKGESIGLTIDVIVINEPDYDRVVSALKRDMYLEIIEADSPAAFLKELDNG